MEQVMSAKPEAPSSIAAPAGVQTSDVHELKPAPSELVALLASMPLFASLEARALQNLARAAVTSEPDAGQVIVHQGEPGGSLLVIESGDVELTLQRAGLEPVRLGMHGRGDFLGDMSLFDGTRRGASARAITRCRIHTIDGKALEQNATVPMMMRMLSVVAQRVRNSDATVLELSERVYRAAYNNVHAAVSVELDSIKTLYRRNEQLAADALARAQQHSQATLARADHAVSQVDARFEQGRAALIKYAKWVAGALAALGIGCIGAATWVMQMGREVQQTHANVQRAAGDIAEVQRRVHEADAAMQVVNAAMQVVKETMTDLRATREAAGLGQRIQSAPQLTRIAQNYEPAKRAVMARYLAPGSAAAGRFEPEVMLEAAMTYMTLASEGRADKQLVLQEAERDALSATLLGVLERLPPALGQRAGPEPTSFAFARQLREAWRWLQETQGANERETLRQRLLPIMRDTQRAATVRVNAALVFVRLGDGKPRGDPQANVTAIELLTDAMRGEPSWLSMASALALSELGERAGWDELRWRLRDPGTRYMAADTMAQAGGLALRGLASEIAPAEPPEALITQLETILTAQVAAASHCFEQRYARWLLGCLQGPCRQTATEGELGGACEDRPLAD
jgi:CRP-like cAMP-binding protein